MKKRKKKRLKTLKPGCATALELLERIQKEAKGNGLAIKITVPVGKRRPTLHWMFNDLKTGKRVLNYWPATGTWMTPTLGDGSIQRGRCLEPQQAFDEALRWHGCAK